MTTQGTPAGGFKTVGQIVGTNDLRFHAKQSGLAIAIELLSLHASGALVVDDTGRFIGFVGEFDLLGSNFNRDDEDWLALMDDTHETLQMKQYGGKDVPELNPMRPDRSSSKDRRK